MRWADPEDGFRGHAARRCRVAGIRSEPASRSRAAPTAERPARLGCTKRPERRRAGGHDQTGEACLASIGRRLRLGRDACARRFVAPRWSARWRLRSPSRSQWGARCLRLRRRRPRRSRSTPRTMENRRSVAYAPDDGYTYVAWSAGGNRTATASTCASCRPTPPVARGAHRAAARDRCSQAPTRLASVASWSCPPAARSSFSAPRSAPAPSRGPRRRAARAFLAGSGGPPERRRPDQPRLAVLHEEQRRSLSSTDVGIFDSYDHFYSYFSDSPFTGPETPSSLPSNEGNANNGGQFRRQARHGGAGDRRRAGPRARARRQLYRRRCRSQRQFNETHASGCINDAATGYGVDVGTSGPSGTLNSQGLQPKGFGLLACSAEDPTLASGGTDGIGVLEEEGSAITGAGSDWQIGLPPVHRYSHRGLIRCSCRVGRHNRRSPRWRRCARRLRGQQHRRVRLLGRRQHSARLQPQRRTPAGADRSSLRSPTPLTA